MGLTTKRIQRMPWLNIANDPMRDLDFVLPGLVCGTTAMLVGPGGVSKSFLALQTAISIAIGRDIWHLWTDGDRLKKGRVVVVNLEDTEDILAVRMKYIAETMQVDDIITAEENFDVLPLAGLGFDLGVKDPVTKKIIATEWLKYLEEYCQGARLIIIDTFNRAANGLDENSSAEMGPLIGLIDGMCRRIGCACLILHHVNKMSMVGAMSGAQFAARGASAITDNARWQTNLSTMSKEEGETRSLDVEIGEHKRWVQIDLSKVNYGPPVESKWAFRGPGGVLDGKQPLSQPITPKKKAAPATAAPSGPATAKRGPSGAKLKAFQDA